MLMIPMMHSMMSMLFMTKLKNSWEMMTFMLSITNPSLLMTNPMKELPLLPPMNCMLDSMSMLLMSLSLLISSLMMTASYFLHLKNKFQVI